MRTMCRATADRFGDPRGVYISESSSTTRSLDTHATIDAVHGAWISAVPAVFAFVMRKG